MAHVSHKLSGAVEGAFAGGGDPATSPLYVFGPFLRLIVVAGVGSVVMGAAIWLAVLTVVVVTAMYRLVLKGRPPQVRLADSVARKTASQPAVAPAPRSD